MAGQTTLLFQGNTVSAGDAFSPQVGENKTGLVTCTFTSGATVGFKVEIQGRLDGSDHWAVLGTFDETDLDSNDAAAAEVPLMAIMRAECTVITGSPPANDLVVRLQE
jgi:hypothetical protein